MTILKRHIDDSLTLVSDLVERKLSHVSFRVPINTIRRAVEYLMSRKVRNNINVSLDTHFSFTAPNNVSVALSESEAVSISKTKDVFLDSTYGASASTVADVFALDNVDVSLESNIRLDVVEYKGLRFIGKTVSIIIDLITVWFQNSFGVMGELSHLSQNNSIINIHSSYSNRRI